VSIVHFGKTCRICHKGIAPVEALHCGNERRGYICLKCQSNYHRNYNILTQQLTEGACSDRPVTCAQCNRDLDQIHRVTGQRSLYAQWIDGVLALLCKFCSDAYIPKSGQFEQTEFGKRLGVTGYK
jgi:hypothetical protein